MKILFIASCNDMSSGAFLSLAKLSSILKNRYKVGVHIILPYRGSGTKILEIEKLSYSIIPSYQWSIPIGKKRTWRFLIRCSFYKMINWYASIRIAKVLKAEKIDIVHINTSKTYVGAVAAKKNATPYVWHLREFMEEDHNQEIWNKKKGYNLMNQANAIIAISDSIKLKYDRIFNPKKIVKIYNGIDVDRFYSNNHKIFTNKMCVITILGTISNSKGQKQAILACEELIKAQFTRFKLRIVGQGSKTDIDELMKIVNDKKLNNYVEFVGFSRDTNQILKNSDIVLMCSTAEAFGRVTVEACVAGALVIGADSGGTTELLNNGEYGLIYKYGDINDLSEKILYAINNVDKMRLLATKGQEYMFKNMTAEINAKKIYTVYKKILKKEEV